LLTPDGVRIADDLLRYVRECSEVAERDRALFCDTVGVRHLFVLAVMRAGDEVSEIRDSVREGDTGILVINPSFFDRALGRLVDIDAVSIGEGERIALTPYGRRIATLVATRRAWRDALLGERRPFRQS
jgi:hypothetical protein